MVPPGEARSGRLLVRFAQALSLSALCLWIVMLWVPVAASPEDTSEEPQPPRIIVTALGGPPFDLDEARGSMVLVAAGVLICAAASPLLTVRSRPDSHPWPDVVGRLWSVGNLFLSVCVFLVSADMLANMPTFMWDAVDDRGRPVFGIVVAEPALGAVLWAIGGLSLLAAGVCGLLGEVRRRKAAPAHCANARITPWPRGNRTHRLAQRLPWVALACWVLMIWVPLFDSGDHGDDRLTVTSFGRVPFDLADRTPGVILPWVVVLACAATAKRFDTFAHWPLLSVAVGVGLFIQQATMVIDLPRERVESTDATGETLSAIIVGYPSAGHYLWTIGCWALIAAGICGLLSDRRRIDRQMQRQAQRPTKKINRRRQRKLQQWARLLPFTAVGVWTVTVFVPVVDSFNDDGPRIRVTSLGEWTIDDGGDVDLFFLIIWALVVAIAALGAAFAPARWWDVTAVIIAALIVLVLFSYLVSPPVLMWDGQLPDGTPTGGMEVGRPSFGFGLWLIGAAALVAAGICGLLTQTKCVRPAVQGPPAGGV
ncbi:hypothetical protein GCM10010974_14480 [Brevibacterium sediminis]|uniref:Uncharacterized protein n=2 Tax=Brevibacterium sediminis TaxID=1857024 RepID=A0ABQ1M7Z3_9MICO|nr:hypothetical protein GCM10010974_14480 [Brevibacterium sediminis]